MTRFWSKIHLRSTSKKDCTGKSAVAMIERRAIPKIGSFVDIVLSYDNQEFHVLTIDSALRLETNAAFVATNDKRQTVDAHLASETTTRVRV
jgi:hypothetical protein